MTQDLSFPFKGKTTGPAPWYSKLTPADFEKIRTAIGSGRFTQPAAVRLVAVVSDKAVYRGVSDGYAALAKHEKGEELTDREKAAVELCKAVMLGTDRAESVLMQHALGDENIISTTPDVKDTAGNVVQKGRTLRANVKCAQQAAWLLGFTSPRFQEGYAERLAATEEPEKTAPTREELIADLRTLVQTDPDLIAEAGLSVK